MGLLSPFSNLIPYLKPETWDIRQDLQYSTFPQSCCLTFRRTARVVHESADAASAVLGEPGGRGSAREAVCHGLLGWRPPSRDWRWKVKEVGKATGSNK